jgi:hypothetical protein
VGRKIFMHQRLGECKVSGREFSDQILRENIEFAQEIGSSKIFFSCFEHIEELQSRLKGIEVGNTEVKILGKDELFYQAPGLLGYVETLEQMRDQMEDIAPKSKAEIYKQSLELLKNDFFG